MKHIKLVGVVIGAHVGAILGAVLLFPGCASVDGPDAETSYPYPPGDEVTPLPPRPAPTPVPLRPVPAPPDRAWQERYTSYQVQKGDTMSGIAARFGLRAADIAALSGIDNPNKLRVGQVLKLPGKIDVGAAPAPAPQPRRTTVPAPVSVSVPAGGLAYVVQKGDVLTAIAQRHGVSWRKLAEFNKLTNPNTLKVGQTLKIPGSQSAPAPNPGVGPTAPDRAAPTPPVDEVTDVPDGDVVTEEPETTTDTAEDGAEIITTPEGRFRVVRAKPGEDLYELAISWKCAPSELRRINNLTGSTLQPGQKIKVPHNE